MFRILYFLVFTILSLARPAYSLTYAIGLTVDANARVKTTQFGTNINCATDNAETEGDDVCETTIPSGQSFALTRDPFPSNDILECTMNIWEQLPGIERFLETRWFNGYGSCLISVPATIDGHIVSRVRVYARSWSGMLPILVTGAGAFMVQVTTTGCPEASTFILTGPLALSAVGRTCQVTARVLIGDNIYLDTSIAQYPAWAADQSSAPLIYSSGTPHFITANEFWRNDAVRLHVYMQELVDPTPSDYEGR